MVQTEFETRVKVQQVVDTHLPSFILDENPKAAEFLKQYYISQEFQGGVIDIVENLDQYLKIDSLTSDAISETSSLSSNITSDATEIVVSSVKGYPKEYGLLKIDDEIITYTGINGNTFTGCIRGFSGITTYHKDLNSEELIFSTSSSSSHNSGSSVENLSSLFLKEFYVKLKRTFAPGLENLDFAAGVDAGNFLKSIRNFYESKGSSESFRILFNILFGETPKVVNLEDYLIKPSSSNYIQRSVVLVEVISGDPKKLVGQTITKTNDQDTNASVSEVEIFNRNNKEYYKVNLFIGSDAIQGDFIITPNTKVTKEVIINSNVIDVDSTIGFSKSGTLYSGSNVISYTDKTINQFLGCSNVTSNIEVTSNLRSNDTYYGYEDGDLTKKVEFIISGILSEFVQTSEELDVSENSTFYVKNVGENINNPSATDKKYKEVFAYSWIYNSNPSFKVIDNTYEGDTNSVIVTDPVYRTQIKKGDSVQVVTSTNQIVLDAIVNQDIIDGSNVISLDNSFNASLTKSYFIRRKSKTSSSTGCPIQYGNNLIIGDIHNVYNEDNDNFYVASNSLPTFDGLVSKYSYNIEKTTNKISNIKSLLDYNNVDNTYGQIEFNETVPFIIGDEVFYQPTTTPIVGLETGLYYIAEIEGEQNTIIRLASSRSFIGSGNYVKLNNPSSGINASDFFILNSQKDNEIGYQKLLKKFPFVKDNTGDNDETSSGEIGMLINGVEISNYKLTDSIYYGPLSSVDVLNGGSGYDVINLPNIDISTGLGVTAKIQPVISGSIEKVYVDAQEFDIDQIVAIGVSGGNGFGAVLDPVLIKRKREVLFDARTIPNGGGINTIGDTLTFSSDHNFIDGEEVIYNNRGNVSLGLGDLETSTNTFANNGSYFIEVINDQTVKLFESKLDSLSGINTVGLITANTSGIHKFLSSTSKNTLSEIKIINGGQNYTNRKLIVNPSGISSSFDTVYFKDHNFNNGDLVEYSFETSTINGLSSNNQYYILKVDSDYFRLCDAGIGGTNRSNFEQGIYTKLSSTGSGYQNFKYPDISVFVDFVSSSASSSQTISALPSVKGSIVDSYLYESGTGYGSSVLNFEKKPIISIQNGLDGSLIPNILGGTIDSVSIEYGGREYYSVPDLIVSDSSGSGIGAELRAIISNGKISDVKIINAGIGYSSTSTSIEVKSSGSNAIIDSNVRKLTVNANQRYGKELLKQSVNKLKYSVCGYSKNYLSVDSNNVPSPIIGWAYDGNPIYGPYANNDPSGVVSGVSTMISGYTATADLVDRPSINDFPSGYFVEDYEFTNPSGCHLDMHNGRFEINEDFPQGVYAYHAIIDDSGNPLFPYFIGNTYKSKYVKDNDIITQDYDFNNSNLIRNTFSHNTASKDANYDFVYESSSLNNQQILVNSVFSGSVDSIDIISGGDNYKVNDILNFNDENTNGSGLNAKVSFIGGKNITEISKDKILYQDVIFTWNNGREIEVNINPKHEFKNEDYVTIGSTSIRSLNNIFKIGVTTYYSSLSEKLDASASIGTTEIYLSNIPPVSIGSSIGIGTETLSILNIYEDLNVITVKRGLDNVGHSTGSIVNFIPNSFTIPFETNYFNSSVNKLAYFNSTNAVGFGTTVGISSQVSFEFGGFDKNRNLPTQSIFIERHPFYNNQQVTLEVPSGGGFTIKNTPNITETAYNLPSAGLTTTVYVTSKGRDYIGIKTTLQTDEIFFFGGGTDSDEYKIQSNFDQILGSVEKVTTRVSVSTDHNLSVGDVVDLTVQPNLTVGIGTAGRIIVKEFEEVDRLSLNSFRVRPDGFGSIPTATSRTGIVSVTDNTVSIVSHEINTGDKLLYVRKLTGELLPFVENRAYYAVKIDDDTFKLSETYTDSIKSPPLTINFDAYNHTPPYSLHSVSFELLNPQVKVVKGNDLKFTTSSFSTDYELKFYTDNEFNNEFVSTGSTSILNIDKNLNSYTIKYSENLPSKLYYNITRGGYISTTDTDVKNYNEIVYVDSTYTGQYAVSGIGSTTFDIVLTKKPEKDSYVSSECSVLEYKTSSTTEKGPIKDISILSKGSGYKKIPAFSGSNSIDGINALLLSKSKTIGKLKTAEFINDNFRYSSDKTLSPEAFVPPSIEIKNYNTIGVVTVTNGGSGYSSPPSLVVIDELTGQELDSGILSASLSGSSISGVDIISEPKGLPDTEIGLYAKDNTNGISILTVESNSSGIFTCFITTPTLGFSVAPFTAGDKVFVEGIEKYSSSGTGFNSKDYGYKLFDVVSYDGTPGNVNQNPSKVVIDISNLGTNTGIAKTNQDSLGTLINQNDYPNFLPTKKRTSFLIGEVLIVNSVEEDIYVSEIEEGYIKIKGTFELSKNDIIVGKDSGTKATVDNIEKFSGRFKVEFSNVKDLGWSDDVGKLDIDTQVVSDNDYYQNLSYTVKSKIPYEKQKTPVSNLIHTSGLKNFADTTLMNTANVSVGNTDSSISIRDIVQDLRVDTLYNFDISKDIIGSSGNSKFIQFLNTRLSSYTEIDKNLVYIMDDINSQFSNLEDQLNPSTKAYICELGANDNYTNFLLRVSDSQNTQIQLTELSILNTLSGHQTLVRGELSDIGVSSHTSNTNYGVFSVDTDEYNETNLVFTPNDPYNKDYNIKVLKRTFENDSIGINTLPIGFANLTSSVKSVSSGQTVDIIGVSTDNSLLINSEVINSSANQIDFVETYLTHDTHNTYLAESYYNNSIDVFSGNSIGSFGADISSGVVSLKFTNNSTDTVLVKSRIVGFGSTSIGEGSYKFTAVDQPSSSARHVEYRSDTIKNRYGSGGYVSDPYVLSLNKDLYDAVKSTIQVSTVYIDSNGTQIGVGTTVALYQVMMVNQGGRVDIQESQFLYTEDADSSTSINDANSVGMGTFGGDYDSNNLILRFYPNNYYNNTELEISAFSECLFTSNDTVNISTDLTIGGSFDSTFVKKYAGINGEVGNKKNFELTTDGIPIFAKSFNPENSTQLTPNTGTFSIDNHFFKHNEELIYTPKSTFVGIGSTPMMYKNASAGIVSTLPSEVFVVISNSDDDGNTFQISTTRSGTAVTFTGFGEGNAHQFEMKKSNEKSLITLDEVVQYPLIFTSTNYNVVDEDVGINTTIFALSGISTLGSGNILKIDDEYVKITNVGFGTTSAGPITGIGTTSLVQVERGVLGSVQSSHSLASVATLYKGSYNIKNGQLYFVSAPRGDANQEKNSSNIIVPTSDFAGRVYFRSNYDSNIIYDDISEEFNGIGRTFTLTVGGANTSGIGTTGGNGIMFINGVFQTPTTFNNTENNFSIVENTSPSPGISSVIFTGITSAGTTDIKISETDINQNQIPRGGIIVSLGSSGGLGYSPLVGAYVTTIVGAGGSILDVGAEGEGTYGSGYNTNVSVAVTDLIYDHKFVRCGLNSITDDIGDNHTATDAIYNSLTGDLILTIPTHNLTTSNKVRIDNDGIVFTCSKDGHGSEHAYPRAISKTQLRRGIAGVGDPISGILTAITSTTNNTITIDVHPGGGAGSGGQVTAAVGAGGTLAFTLVGHGTDYVNPEIYVTPPSYDNLDAIGISRVGIGSTTDTGLGLKMSVEVGGASTTVGIGSTHFEVKSFSIKNPGYSFIKGDKFTLVGLVTDARQMANGSEALEPFTLEVLDIYTDNFAMWQFGNFDYIDSIKDLQDGERTNFPLIYNGDVISFETPSGVTINFENNLLIFINGILQEPGKSYTFNGGTSFDFTAAPKSIDNVDIFFYQGTVGEDTTSFNAIRKTLEKGDNVQLNSIDDVPIQNQRRVYDIAFSDKVETELYTGLGISTEERNIDIIKQKRDIFVNGEEEFKIRDTLEPLIFPTSKIIKNLSTSDTEIHVDNAEFFNKDALDVTVDGLLVNGGASNPVSASATAILSNNEVSSLNLISSGSGYAAAPTVSISAPLQIGVGIGTTATATANMSGDSVSSFTITNSGFGYTTPPSVLISYPNTSLEVITGINTNVTRGFSGIITGIGTTTSGSNLALKFNLYSTDDDFDDAAKSIQSETALYIFDTRIGTGITSLETDGSGVVGIGTTFADNVYYAVHNIALPAGVGGLGIITCVIDPNTSIVGLATTGSFANPVGRFSWGKLTMGSRSSSNPISLTVKGLEINSGLSSFPTIQRRGQVGFRENGAIDK
jgi:hypothetical protein